MWMVYRANGVVNGGTRIYERAYKAHPHRQDFAQLAFCGLVREAEYGKQGLLARKLCKDFEQDRYFFWSVCSMATQAWDGGLGAGDMQLGLAEKMMAKALQEGKLKDSEELRLYIQILQQQGKRQEAADLLANPEGEVMKSMLDSSPDTNPSGWELQQDLAVMHHDLANYPASLTIYQAQLQGAHPDNWAFWLGHLDAALAGEPATSDNVASTVSLAGSISEKDPRLRGPCLVPLEAAARRLQAGEEAALEELCEGLVRYLERFGSKSCAASDVRAYLHVIPLSQRVALIATVQAKEEEEAGSDLAALAKLQKSITRHCVLRLLGHGSGKSVEESTRAAVSLVEAYEASLPLNEGMEASERGHGDPLLVLASYYLADAYRSHGSMPRLLHAIALLRRGCKDSERNFEYRVVLMRLLVECGAVSEALELFTALDVKHVQYESLAHELIAGLNAAGLLKEARLVSGRTLHFHSEASREVPEYTANAYRYENYSKVSEFVDFGKKLKRSATAAAAAASLGLWYHSFAGLVMEPYYAMAAERLKEVSPRNLVSNEDHHSIQRWEALPVGPMPPRWDTTVGETTRIEIAARVHATRGVHAALGVGNPTPDALAGCLSGIQELPGWLERATSRLAVRLMEAVGGMEGLLTAEAEANSEGDSIVKQLGEAEAAIEELQAEAMIQIQAATEAATGAAGGVVTLEVGKAAQLLQDTAPVALLLAKACVEAFPASKGGKKKKKEDAAKEGWSKVKEALRGLINTVGIAIQAMGTEAKTLHKALAACGKVEGAAGAGVESGDLKASAALVAKSHQATATQLQGTAKLLAELAKTAAQAARS